MQWDETKHPRDDAGRFATKNGKQGSADLKRNTFKEPVRQNTDYDDILNNDGKKYQKTFNAVIKGIKEEDLKFWGAGKETQPATIFSTIEEKEFVFQSQADFHNQGITPEQAIHCFYCIPKNIRKHAQKRIYFVGYENPEDELWRKEYKDFTSSGAIGDNEEIIVFKNNGYSDQVLTSMFVHEIGHKIDDENGNGHVGFSHSANWIMAKLNDMAHSGISSPTDYGNSHLREDFAESLMVYNLNPSVFKKYFPARAKIIESILNPNK